MGLLTVDVTPFGIVMTSDSQLVDLYGDRWAVTQAQNRKRNPIVAVRLPTFTGLAGSVGAERVAGKPTREWLEKALSARKASTLPELCQEFAGALTAIWTSDSPGTLLSLFLAGYEGSDPRFWWVSNGEPPMDVVPTKFDAVDDLDGVWFPRNAKAGEKTTGELVAKAPPSFRRGVLLAATIFDRFTQLVSDLIGVGHIGPLTTLERYAAYAKFRFEFTKRMYDVRYGFATDPQPPPVDGDIHVYSVDPSGSIKWHPKHLGQAREVT